MNFKLRRAQGLILLSTFLSMAVLMTGCGGKSSVQEPQSETAQSETAKPEAEKPEATEPQTDTQEPLTKIEYSNLTDDASQQTLKECLEAAEVSEKRINHFFEHVDQFNKSVSAKSLTKGFETAGVLDTKYDSYEMQDEWLKNNPDFEGYNCRITAFGLFGDFVTVQNPLKKKDKDFLSIDFLALEQDPSALADDKNPDRFNTLFSTVQTEDTKEIASHVKSVQKSWEEHGIQFEDSGKIRLITVFFHDQPSPEENILYIGHVGVLLPVSEQELYFVEKVAFQEPYRVLKFKNRTELSDYLMEKYDISWGQPTASPFIMENGQLMEGYRENQTKQEQQ